MPSLVGVVKEPGKRLKIKTRKAILSCDLVKICSFVIIFFITKHTRATDMHISIIVFENGRQNISKYIDHSDNLLQNPSKVCLSFNIFFPVAVLIAFNKTQSYP